MDLVEEERDGLAVCVLDALRQSATADRKVAGASCSGPSSKTGRLGRSCRSRAPNPKLLITGERGTHDRQIIAGN